MRNMSFMLTTEQIRNRTKTVTRRLGWKNLKPGERFWACEKCQGLKKGERIERLALLECVGNSSIMLGEMLSRDCELEGFPELTPEQFISMFCREMKCQETTIVQRIEFKYVDEP